MIALRRSYRTAVAGPFQSACAPGLVSSRLADSTDPGDQPSELPFELGVSSGVGLDPGARDTWRSAALNRRFDSPGGGGCGGARSFLGW